MFPTMMEGDVMQRYEHGRGARMRCLRDYLGLDPDGFAAELGVSPRSVKSWESGRDPIPEGIWPLIDAVEDRADEAVSALVEQADGGGLRVPVWRGDAPKAPMRASMWRMVVARAMAQNPAIEPVFPEDAESDDREVL